MTFSGNDDSTINIVLGLLLLLLPAGLPQSGKVPVLFLLSSQKSTFCPPSGKTMN